MNTVGVHQIEHLVWTGLLDKINKSNIIILGDDFQFKKNYVENRNKIRTPQGSQWVTVPIKGSTHLPMNEILINNDTDWRKSYLGSIRQNYSKSKFFSLYYSELESIINKPYDKLFDLSLDLLLFFLDKFNIRTKILMSSTFSTGSLKGSRRLLELCKAVKADTYLSGMSGRDYLDLELFSNEGINVKFHEFFHQAYKQFYPGFEYGMSALDLMFNHGEKGCQQFLDGKGILSMSSILNDYPKDSKILETFGGNGEGHLEAYALDNPNVTIWELDEDNATQLEIEYPKAKVMNVNSLEEIITHNDKYDIIIVDSPAKLSIVPVLVNLYRLVDKKATVIIRLIEKSYNDNKGVDLSWIGSDFNLPNLKIVNYKLEPREAYFLTPWLSNCVLEVEKI